MRQQFPAGKMSEPESADNCIEGAIRKWEMFYVSLTKIDARVQSPRQFYHLWRQVDADRAPHDLRLRLQEHIPPSR
jgi:hypothetical protein